MNEQSIFFAALEMSPNQRVDYLDQACADDPLLRQKVDALFAAHERSGEFLDVPALERMAAAGALEDRIPGGEASAEQPDAPGQIDLSFLEPSTASRSLGRLRHYEVQEIIGRGGCGIVLKAFDEKLHRIVAIKVMAPELAATSPARKRFLREARATAAIRHENVVSIYAVEEQPLPFLVMEYIDGLTLQQKLDQTGPLDVREVLRIGHQIASGLEAAHAKGLIHRDIKPGNILLENRSGHVKITDFGLARSVDDASMTQSGAISGTPLYMSPEQAQGNDIDQRSDLFSMGSVLYVMCSGRPPFRAATTMAVLRRVVEEQPRPIQGIIPEVPDWLIAIITRLHAKNPEDRFASAQKVGELLARCQSELQQHGRVASVGDLLSVSPPLVDATQEPSHGESPTFDEKASPAPAIRTARPRQRRWVATAVMILVLLTGLGMTEATGVTNVRGTVIRLFSPDGTLVVEVDDPEVNISIDGEDIVITGAGVKEIRLKPGQYQVLARKDGKVVSQELVTVTKNGRQVVRVSKETQPVQGHAEVYGSSPKTEGSPKIAARRLPTPSAALTALRRDQISPAALAFAGDGDPKKAPTSLVAVLGLAEPIHTGVVNALAFSDDGRWLVSASGDRTILVWDAATMKILRVLRGHSNSVTSAAFTPDGKTIVSGSADGTIKLWSRVTEVEPTTIQPGIGPLQMAISPDGRFLAAGVGGKAASVKLWKWGQWQTPVEVPVLSKGDAMTLAFSPDGQMLACGYGFMTESPIDLFNTADGKLKQTLPSLNGAVNSLSFSRDGKSLASTGPSPGKLTTKARIWNLDSDKAVDMGAPGYRVCLSPDGKTLAVGSWKHVEIYDVESQKQKEGTEALSCAGHAWGLAFSPDGKTLVVGDDGGAVNFYDTASWQPKKGFLESSHRGTVMGLAGNPNGRTILSIGVDRTLRSWDLERAGNNQIVYRGNQQFMGGLACSPDGTSFTVADDKFVIWDAESLKEKHRFAAMIGPVVYSPDGRTLAGQQRHPDIIQLWDVKQGKTVHSFPALKELASDLAFSVDGRRLAVAGMSGKVVVWDVATGNEVAAWKDTQMRSVAFHPDGRSLATGHSDGTITFWDTSTWKKERTLHAHTGPVVSLKFTPDGKTLLSSGTDGVVQVRNPDHDRAREMILVGPAGSTVRFDLDSSGKYLFVTGPTQAIQVHKLPTGDDETQAAPITTEVRKALEWVLSVGGTVYVKSEGKLLSLHQGARLPDGPFTTKSIFLRGSEASKKVDDNSVESLKALPHFDLLALTSSRVGDVGLGKLASYPWFANLDHLALDDTPISDAGMAHIHSCKRLHWLTLGNLPVTGKGLAHLRGLPLSILWLAGCREIGDDAAEILAEIPTLSDLQLHGTAVTPEGIAKLTRLPNLRSLYVSGDAATDDLVAVVKLRGLTSLRIDSPSVTDAGLARLSTLSDLKELIFTESKNVTDASVDQIAKCKNLRTFNVKRCGITEAGVKKLTGLRPDLRIWWDGGIIEPSHPAL